MNNVETVVVGALVTTFRSTAALSDPKGPTELGPRVAVGGTPPVSPVLIPVLRHKVAAKTNLGDGDGPKPVPALGFLIASLLSIPIWGTLVLGFRLWFGD